MRARFGAALLAVALLAPILNACGADSGDDGRKVVIYSGRTQNLVQPILDRFATETGISVEVRYGDTADLALLIEEEGDRSPADMFLSQSPGSVGYLDRAKLLGTLPADVLALVPESVRAGDGSWVGLSGRQRVLAFNPEETPEASLPASVLDMVKPEWRGRVGVAPSNASFQDFVTAMRIVSGDAATKTWLEGIANNDAFTFANNAAIVAAVGRGEIDVGLVNHYYVFQARAQDPAFKGANHYFAKEDIGSLLIVTAAAVLAHADHKAEAVELARFFLQAEAQQYFSEQTYEYPLATGVAPIADLPPLEFGRRQGLDLDQLGGDLQSTRKLIRDAGLKG